jgi:hypothetical protein
MGQARINFKNIEDKVILYNHSIQLIFEFSIVGYVYFSKTIIQNFGEFIYLHAFLKGLNYF